MKKREDISKKERSAAVGLVVSFVAMIAIVGMITFSQYQRKLEDQKLAEAQRTEEQNKVAKEKVEENKKDTSVSEEKEPTQITNTDDVQAEIVHPENREIISAPIKTNTLSFSSGDTLAWPVDGNVILGYSMDKTVYFSTLDQYKYNPAIIISSEVGSEVRAAADAKVEAVEVNAKTGTTIRMSLGSGYEVIYGQLQDVTLEAGDQVERGEIIGSLSAPTKYYTVEGPNLYFEMRKEGKTVNPMEYMEG